jgi:hypothetical protein
MIKTNEADAKTRWCPFARVPVAVASANRDLSGKRQTGTNCIGTECMAWRWHSKRHGYCGLVENGISHEEMTYILEPLSKLGKRK